MIPIVQSLHAAWRLFKLDPEGMGGFDLTVGGFWRSFAAFPFALVFYVPFSVIEARSRDASPAHHVSLEVAGLALSWLAALAVLLGVAALLRCTHRYAAAVIAWNWVTALGMVLLAAAHVVAFALPPFALVLVVGAIGYGLWVKYFVVRTALEVSPLIAGAAVVATLSATLLIDLGTTPLR